jgi:hypothetical protein
MVKIIPNQSGMDFIADNTFHIEESSLYKNIGEGVRSVEFIRIKDNLLVFVEAKTAFPNPNNPSEENYAKFQSEIGEVCEKFTHSLNLFSLVEVGLAEEEYPNDFTAPARVSLVFMLVIKNHKLDWCRNVKGKFIAALPRYLKKIWKPTVYVINQEIAMEQGFVVC